MEISVNRIITFAFLWLIFLAVLCFPLGALESPLFHEVLGKKFAFTPEMGMFRSSGLALTNIKGRPVISLSPLQGQRALYDLKLSFDGADLTGSYALIRSAYETNTVQRAAGSASAKFVSAKNALVFMPKPSSILGGGGLSVQSFTIDFWLYPYRTGEGSQTVMEFKGRNRENPLDPRTYGLSIAIEKNTLTYTLENFFRDKNTNTYSFVLSEKTPVSQEQWERHTFVLDAPGAALRVYRGGVEQQVIPLTADKTPDGGVLFPADHIDRKGFPLYIGKNALFSLDEFSISRDVQTNFIENRRTARFLETEVFTVSPRASYVQGMNISGLFPGESGVRLAYRFSTNYFLAEDSTLPWVYVSPEKKSFPPSLSLGKYFQWRFEYTPPATGDASMELYALTLDYRENNIPAPLNLNLAEEGEGRVVVTWNSLPDPSILSYEIFYGTQPGVYVGGGLAVIPETRAGTPSRPMSHSLEGLDNDQAYYIIIRARDKFGNLGPASKELYVRPSALKASPFYSIGM